jgi:hypothetical protein
LSALVGDHAVAPGAAVGDVAVAVAIVDPVAARAREVPIPGRFPAVLDVGQLVISSAAIDRVPAVAS